MATKYLDNAASGANNGTSWANAWESVASVSLSAGDTLYISGGAVSKTYTEAWTISANGTADNRITITVSDDASHNGTVIFDGGDSATGIVISGDYVTFSGYSGTPYRIRVKSYTSGNGNIRMTGAVGTILDGIDITDAGHAHCLRMDTSTDCIVRRCRLRTAVGEIGYNADGIFSTGNTRAIYEDLWIGVYATDALQHDDCIQLYKDNATIIRNCYCEQVNDKISNAQGIYVEECYGNILVYNNVVYNLNGNNCIGFRGYDVSTAVPYVYNNTCYGGGYGNIIIGAINDIIPDPVIKNNILYHSTNHDYAIKVYEWDGTAGNMNYNCVYAPLLEDVAYYKPLGGAAAGKTWAEWQLLGFDANGINVDPDLTVDYEPQAASPVVDVGADLSGTFTTDKNGIARPQGTAWDIGAYEYYLGPTDGAKFGDLITVASGAGLYFFGTPTDGVKLGDSIWASGLNSFGPSNDQAKIGDSPSGSVSFKLRPSHMAKMHF